MRVLRRRQVAAHHRRRPGRNRAKSGGVGPLAAAVEIEAIADGSDGASGADLRELVRRSVLADGDAVTTATLERNACDGAWSPTGAGLYV